MQLRCEADAANDGSLHARNSESEKSRDRSSAGLESAEQASGECNVHEGVE
jgi:hypothetical protein